MSGLVKELNINIILQFPADKLSRQIYPNKSPYNFPKVTQKLIHIINFPLYSLGEISETVEIVKGKLKP